jgi:hypothetical protein
MWHAVERGEMHTRIWRVNFREKGQLEHQGVDGRLILNWIFKKKDGRTWIGLTWLRIETIEGPL